jgi:hypothetical protein
MIGGDVQLGRHSLSSTVIRQPKSGDADVLAVNKDNV